MATAALRDLEERRFIVGLDPPRVATMKKAALEIMDCYRVLRKVGANIVGEIIRTEPKFVEWDHYPSGDVFDEENKSQYYYHAHRGASGEHGHFHTFIRSDAFPEELRSVPASEGLLAHLVAISMDAYGYPTHMFTTNRWVTGEAFFPASEVMKLLDLYAIDHAWPSWPANRWITAMLRLFRPQIEILLHKRDAVIDGWRAVHGDDALEDRDLEITSIVEISVERQIELLNGTTS